MERDQTFELDNFIQNWVDYFPNYQLTVANLKEPHMLMGALFQVFERLGIDRDAVLAPPPEEHRTESLTYYLDLLPVINMTRIVNYLLSVMPQTDLTYTVKHFLQPTIESSYSILMLHFNLVLFNDNRLKDIEPYEQELFDKTNQVKTLEDRKNKLLEMLNEQAKEKGQRAERLEKLNSDIKQYEEELKQEKEKSKEEKQELEAILKENTQTKIILEQKKTHRDALMAEVARKRALRVYDADDIKAQAEQATQNVQEAEEKLNSLRTTLMQKEHSLKNLQSIKPSLDQAKNLLHDIMNLSEGLKESESGDLEWESKEGEVDVVRTEVCELRALLAEVSTKRTEAETRRQEGGARRQLEKTALENALRDAEEKDRKSQELCKNAVKRTEVIKQLTFKYQQEKTTAFEEITKIKDDFSDQLKTVDELLLREFIEGQKIIEDKLRNKNI